MAMVKVYFKKRRGKLTRGDVITFEGLTGEEAQGIAARLNARTGEITIESKKVSARFYAADVARVEVEVTVS